MNRRGFLKTALATSAAAGTLGALADTGQARPKPGTPASSNDALTHLSLGVQRPDPGSDTQPDDLQPPTILSRAADHFLEALTRNGADGRLAPRWFAEDGEPDILIAAGDFGAAARPELALFGGTPLHAKHVSAAQMIAWLTQSGAVDVWRDLTTDLGWHPIPIATFDGGGVVTLERSGVQDLSPAGTIAAGGLNRGITTHADMPNGPAATADMALATAAPTSTVGLSQETVLRLFAPALKRQTPAGRFAMVAHATPGLTFTPPAIAAFVAKSVWDTLAPETRQFLELAGRSALLSHQAEQTLFQATVQPALLSSGTITLAQGTPVINASDLHRLTEKTVSNLLASGRESATLYHTLATIAGADRPSASRTGVPIG